MPNITLSDAGWLDLGATPVQFTVLSDRVLTYVDTAAPPDATSGFFVGNTNNKEFNYTATGMRVYVRSLPGSRARISTASASTPAPSNRNSPVTPDTGAVGAAINPGQASWDNGVTSRAWAWKRDGVAIGVTTQSYTPVAADAGKTLTVEETATNGGGSTTIASSAIKIAAVALAITASPPAMVVGTAWSVTPVVTGGRAPYRFYYGSNSFPRDTFARDYSNGKLSGTPANARRYMVTIYVQDADGTIKSVDIDVSATGGSVSALGPTTASFTAGSTTPIPITGLNSGETVSSVTGSFTVSGNSIVPSAGLVAGSYSPLVTTSTGRTLTIAVTANAAAPALINDIVAFAGDSRTNFAFESARNVMAARGHASWAAALGGNRWRVNWAVPAQYGIGGDSSLDLRNRWNAVLADPAGTIVMWVGVNDRGKSLTVSDTIANVSFMINAAKSAGKWVVLLDETPRANYADAAGLQQALDTHNWLAGAASLFNNVRVVPSWDALLDASTGASGTATYQPKAGSTLDGLHPSTFGGKLVGTALFPVLNAHLTAGGFSTSYTRPWVTGDATYAATRPALNVNPGLTGTGGTRGTGGTGTVPDGMSAGRGATGITFAITDETISGVAFKVFTFSGTSAGNNEFVFQDLNPFTLASGDVFDARARVILGSGATGIRAVVLEASVTGGTTTVQSRMLSTGTSGTTADVVPPEGFDAVLLTPPATMSADGTGGNNVLRVTFTAGATVSGVVKIAQMATRKAA